MWLNPMYRKVKTRDCSSWFCLDSSRERGCWRGRSSAWPVGAVTEGHARGGRHRRNICRHDYGRDLPGQLSAPRPWLPTDSELPRVPRRMHSESCRNLMGDDGHHNWTITSVFMRGATCEMNRGVALSD